MVAGTMLVWTLTSYNKPAATSYSQSFIANYTSYGSPSK